MTTTSCRFFDTCSRQDCECYDDATPATITPFVFASELQDGQVIIDPRDGIARGVTGVVGRADDTVRVMFVDGTVFDVWRHKPLHLVDVDQVHAEAMAEYAAHRQAKQDQRMQQYTKLNKLTKAELVAKVQETLIYSAYPPAQWRKDELINHIIGW